MPEPTDPTDPTEPTEPTEPTAPTEPAEPTAPTEPGGPTGPAQPAEPVTVYDAVGGQAYFDALAAGFYRRVALDPVLRPLYPEDDESFAAAERWLALFLGQYWGGPTTYSEQRGHPRLRMRHAGFHVGHRERDAWYAAMVAAVAESGVDAELAERLLEYFAMAADHLVNAPG